MTPRRRQARKRSVIARGMRDPTSHERTSLNPSKTATTTPYSPSLRFATSRSRAAPLRYANPNLMPPLRKLPPLPLYAQRALRLKLNALLLIHSLLSLLLGPLLLLLPHSILPPPISSSHYAHEFLRLYACLTLTIGYITYKIRQIPDHKTRQILCEAFSICYATQALVLSRAQISQPVLHGFGGFCFIIVCATLSGFYGWIRFNGSIKVFELPSSSYKSQV